MYELTIHIRKGWHGTRQPPLSYHSFDQHLSSTKGNTMATNINLQTKKPKIIELNFEDMKAEEELLNYVTYPTTDEHLWLACAVYQDRLATGRKSWTDKLTKKLINIPFFPDMTKRDVDLVCDFIGRFG